MGVKTFFTALKNIFPNIFSDKKREEQYYNDPNANLPSQINPDPKEITFAASYTGGGKISDEEMDVLPVDFPDDRMQRYRFIRKMKQDPIISIAIKFHTSSALSWNEEKGAAVIVKPRNLNDKKTDKNKSNIYADAVAEMFDQFKINENLYSWGANVAAYGDKFLRIYTEPGKGIVSILDDETTRPFEMFAYEQGGRPRGYLAPRFQQVGAQGFRLMETWEVVHFRLPGDRVMPENRYQLQAEADKPLVDFDISRPTPDPRIMESHYGDSMIAGAYKAWVKLQRGMESVSTSRWNKSKRDRMTAIGFGNSNPKAALAWVKNIAEMLGLRKKAEMKRKKKWSVDETIDNYIIPYSTADGGKIDFSIVDPNADITAIEDIRMFASMLCGSLGIDPAVAGFTDQIAGGLGEGTMSRQSIIAALHATRLRRAIEEGLYVLAFIHLGAKFGKANILSRKTAPFTFEFHSIATAKEYEELENLMLRMEFADRYAGLLLTLEVGDKLAIAKYFSIEQFKMDRDIIDTFFPKELDPKPEEVGTEDNMTPLEGV